MPSDLTPYDAVLLVSFGGPEQPDDVLPFLRNVTRGRGIPDQRLQEVGEHYFRFGGRSPINDQNRALLAALRTRLDAPVYWGNRNWSPYLTDTVREMTTDGVRRAVAVMTSAYPSYSGCRQYLENIADARAAAGADAPRIDRMRHYANHPGFVDSFVDACAESLVRLPDDAALAFVTHSIPLSMNDNSGPSGGAYVAWHNDVVGQISLALERRTGRSRRTDLVYCSRSGPPQVPWLEPDINEHLEELAKDGASGVVVAPIGFVSDHMEVVYDLDTEAAATADKVGLPMARAATPGSSERFVTMLSDLIAERAAVARGETPDRPYAGRIGPGWDVCAEGCCAPVRRPA